MTRLEEALSKIESLREILSRLEQVTKTIDELVGDVRFLELLEEEIQEETPFVEDGYLRITGTQTAFRWSFEDIVENWRDVYADQGDEGTEAMKKFAEGFHKLGELFDAEAKNFAENP
jgi:hypothetical protein